MLPKGTEIFVQTGRAANRYLIRIRTVSDIDEKVEVPAAALFSFAVRPPRG